MHHLNYFPKIIFIFALSPTVHVAQSRAKAQQVTTPSQLGGLWLQSDWEWHSHISKNHHPLAQVWPHSLMQEWDGHDDHGIISLLTLVGVSGFSEDFSRLEDTACLQPKASSGSFQINEFGCLRVKLPGKRWQLKGHLGLWQDGRATTRGISYYRFHSLFFTLNFSISLTNCISCFPFFPLLFWKTVMSKHMRN